MHGVVFTVATLVVIAGLPPAVSAGGRTIGPRSFQREVDVLPRTVKLRPGEKAIYVRLKKHPRAGASAGLLPPGGHVTTTQAPAHDGKNGNVIVKLTPGGYLVVGEGGIAEVNVEAWGDQKQRIHKLPADSSRRFKLVGGPEGFPTTFHGRTPLHQVGTRRSAGYIYDYFLDRVGYRHVWLDTENQRAHRLVEPSTKGATLVEKDSYLYLTVFNPLMKGRDIKLPIITGDAQVVGVSRQKDVVAGFSYLVIKPTKASGSFKVSDPRLLYDNYTSSDLKSNGVFSYRSLP